MKLSRRTTLDYFHFSFALTKAKHQWVFFLFVFFPTWCSGNSAELVVSSWQLRGGSDTPPLTLWTGQEENPVKRTSSCNSRWAFYFMFVFFPFSFLCRFNLGWQCLTSVWNSLYFLWSDYTLFVGFVLSVFSWLWHCVWIIYSFFSLSQN